MSRTWQSYETSPFHLQAYGAVLPINTAALSKELEHQFAAVINLTKAKTHVQQVALGLLSHFGCISMAAFPEPKEKRQGMLIIHPCFLPKF